LKHGGDKVPAEIKTDVEGKIKALKDILESGSKEDIESKTKELSDTLQKIGEAAYQQGQQAQTEPEIEKEEYVGKTEDSGEEKKDKKDDEKPVEGEVVE
jgi:molecular chaperone DnaK